MDQHHYDVIIIGAGPAGCATACKLNTDDMRVCLIDEVDRKSFKVGGALPAKALPLLNTLGIRELSDILRSNEYSSYIANISSWGSEEWNDTDNLTHDKKGGWHVLRHRFDTALRNYTRLRGATLRKNRVMKIHTSPGEINAFQVHFADDSQPISSTWLVDASGRKGFVTKQLGINRIQYGRQMAIIYWIKSPIEDNDHTTRIKSIRNGWFYTSLLPGDTRMLSFQGLPQDIAELTRSPDIFFEMFNQAELLPYPISMSDVVEGPEATLANVSKPEIIAGPGWLSVGDAAIAFDPLTSYGISFALYSGIQAAEAISTSMYYPWMEKDMFTMFCSTINRVFDKKQKARQYHYTCEKRYQDHPYWQQYKPEIYVHEQ